MRKLLTKSSMVSNIYVPKRSGIITKTMHCTRFAGHALDHHGNCHPGRETVRIENNVRYQSGFCPWQILTRPLLTANSLLASPRSEKKKNCFVPHNWFDLVLYYKIQSFLSYLQKIANPSQNFCFFHSLNLHLTGRTESVSKQLTQLIIAAHNCHNW